MLPHLPPSLRRALAACALAICVTLPAQGAVAASLSLHLQPRNAQEARALGAAITLYAIHRDIRAGADLHQAGRNHAARVHQSGGRNRALIRQHGANHSADLTQTGGHNNQVILQYGNGANANLHQTGGQSGILIQFAP